MSTPGSTSYIFSKKGLIEVETKSIAEDHLMDIALEAGAEDMTTQGDTYEITTDPVSFEAVRVALEGKKVVLKTAEVTMIPTTSVKVTGHDAKSVLALIEALEDNEDVQNVYANFEMSDEDMAAAAGE